MHLINFYIVIIIMIIVYSARRVISQHEKGVKKYDKSELTINTLVH